MSLSAEAITAQPAHRWDNEPAYVLHTYPYKETSLIVELLTSSRGRIAVVAKGAKRATSPLRGLLQPFLALAVSCTGKGEVKTLTKAEWQGGHALMPAPALMSGFYVNELVLKLLPRDDPHTELFDEYSTVVTALVNQTEPASALRQFELRLLAILGYGIDLVESAQTSTPVQAERTYAWLPERGIVSDAPAHAIRVSGTVLRALAQAHPLAGAQAGEAKRFMRHVLDFHLERRALVSRQSAREMQALLETQ
jgi:DNA repair protein RecO (recombination protein O)